MKEISGSLILAGLVFNAFSNVHNAAHILAQVVIREERDITTKSRKHEVFGRADIRD